MSKTNQNPEVIIVGEAKPDCAPLGLLGEPNLNLTMEEIRHLAQFCGMVLTEPTPQEKDDERETEIVIAPWPTNGVKGDDGMLPPHKHIAYYYEYPEEGCVPLGSPNDQAET